MNAYRFCQLFIGLPVCLDNIVIFNTFQYMNCKHGVMLYTKRNWKRKVNTVLLGMLAILLDLSITYCQEIAQFSKK